MQHIAAEHAVVSLVGTSRLIAIPVASHFNDTFRFDSEKLKIGQPVMVVLKTTEAGVYEILLAVPSPTKKKSMFRSRHESESFQDTLALVTHSLSLGDVIKGTVKSVKPTHVLVTINDNLTGSIHASQILDDVSIGTFPTSVLKVGQKVTARVIGGREIKTHR